jgi:SAM-dependent methyltransferase
MASSVGALVSPHGMEGLAVLDIGCGCGDSLVLWKEKFKAARVVGVNLTKSECDLARQRVLTSGYEKSIQVVHQDALAYLFESSARNGFDVTLSVDALYHVRTRLDFLSAIPQVLSNRAGQRCFVAIDTFGTFDFTTTIAGDGAEETVLDWRQAFWKRPFRFVCLCGIAFCTGIPLSNLMYRGESLPRLLSGGVQMVDCQEKTDYVFRPFARHMLSKSLGPGPRSLSTRATLFGVSLFMRLMGSCGLVQVCLYRLDLP